LNKANLSLKPDASEKLEVLITPATDNYEVFYTSTNPEIAEVLADGTVLAHQTGTASVLATVTVGNATYTVSGAVFVEALTLNIEEDKPATDDGSGNVSGDIAIVMEIPSGVLFTGSFKVELPEGVSIDPLLTQLAGSLNMSMELTVALISPRVWEFTITIRQSAQNSGLRRATRSTTEFESARIVDIVYDVDKDVVADGDYEISISNLELTFEDEDNTVISRDETLVPIKVEADSDLTGIVNKKSADLIIYPNPVKSELRIANYDGESVRIFDVFGKQMVNAIPTVIGTNDKSINVSALPAGVYFLKAGNYTRKFIKK
jgi:hypothetical protein